RLSGHGRPAWRGEYDLAVIRHLEPDACRHCAAVGHDRPNQAKARALRVGKLGPTAWLLVCTLTAGWMKAFSSDPRIGFYSLANKYSEAASAGTILAPAKSIAE